jgi:hypothetical protein
MLDAIVRRQAGFLRMTLPSQKLIVARMANPSQEKMVLPQIGGKWGS